MKKYTHLCCIILLLGFLLGVHNGNIALWKDEDPEPIKVFPYRASMLPKADQQALYEGIRAGSIEELYRLIEDYLS